MRSVLTASTIALLLASCAEAVSPEDTVFEAPDTSEAPVDAGVFVSHDVPPRTEDRAAVTPDASVTDVPVAREDVVYATVDVVVSDVATDVPAPRANRRVLIVTLDEETQRECAPHGWSLVTWGPDGAELPASDPGTPLRVEFPWTWRGMLGVGMRCEGAYPAYYRDLSGWVSHASARAGVRSITLDGREIGSVTRVCDPPWVRAAHPEWELGWRVVVLVPIESALEGRCPM